MVMTLKSQRFVRDFGTSAVWILKMSKQGLHVNIFNFFLLSMLFIYPLRFGVHEYFVFLPLGGTVMLLTYTAINTRARFGINKIDCALIFLLFWSVYVVLFSLFNVGIEHSFKGFRIYVFPVLTYFLVRGLLHLGREAALKSIVKFMILSLSFILIYNLYLTVSITFLRQDNPVWFENMGRTENALAWGSRSPGIFGDPHSSGLISVLGGLIIIFNINKYSFIKWKFFKNIIKVFAFICILLSTYRTALIVGTVIFVLFNAYMATLKTKLVIFIGGLVFYLSVVYFLNIYDNETTKYIKIFILWWNNPERFKSALEFILFDGFRILELMNNQFSFTTIIGVGFLSTDNQYNLAEYFRTNDQGWINALQMFGLIGYGVFAYIVGFLLMLVIRVKNSDTFYLMSTCAIVIIVGLLSNMHSDVLKTHGIIQVFYTCLAISSYLYDRIRLNKLNQSDISR